MDRILAHRLLQCSIFLLCKGRWFVNLLLACHELQRNRCKSNGGADRDRTGDLLNAIPFKQNPATPLEKWNYERCPAISVTLPFPSFPLFSPRFYCSTSTRTSTRNRRPHGQGPPGGYIIRVPGERCRKNKSGSYGRAAADKKASETRLRTKRQGDKEQTYKEQPRPGRCTRWGFR